MVGNFNEYEVKLILLPGKSNVKIHPKCVKDLEDILHEGEIPGFVASYEERINFLSDNLGKEIVHRAWFEILKKAHGLRSIRFLNVRNIRILYMIDKDIAFLLLAFEERQGHQKTEYSSFIDSAIERFDEGKE